MTLSFLGHLTYLGDALLYLARFRLFINLSYFQARRHLVMREHEFHQVAERVGELPEEPPKKAAKKEITMKENTPRDSSSRSLSREKSTSRTDREKSEDRKARKERESKSRDRSIKVST